MLLKLVKPVIWIHKVKEKCPLKNVINIISLDAENNTVNDLIFVQSIFNHFNLYISCQVQNLERCSNKLVRITGSELCIPNTLMPWSHLPEYWNTIKYVAIFSHLEETVDISLQ
jgi:hypothetical protein